jgi:peroxiredoxin
MNEWMRPLHRAVALSALLSVLPLRGNQAVAAQPPLVGTSMPEFSLKKAGGGALSLGREGREVHITDGEKTAKPRVVVIHFFQPDCFQCQVQMKGLEGVHQKYVQKGVSVIGIAHRGDAEAAKSLAERLKVSYPLLLGAGSSIGKDFAGGDSLYITDNAGTIRFSQPGYGSGDEALWQDNIDLLLADKPVVKTTTERKNLKVGDRLPAVELDALMTGGRLSLTGTDDHLTFTDAKGRSVQPKAAIGLLARYCAFTREEMVQLQKLHEKYAKDGLLVFTVALHPKPEAAKALTRELGVTYPVFEGHGSDLETQYGFG